MNEKFQIGSDSPEQYILRIYKLLLLEKPTNWKPLEYIRGDVPIYQLDIVEMMESKINGDIRKVAECIEKILDRNTMYVSEVYESILVFIEDWILASLAS